MNWNNYVLALQLQRDFLDFLGKIPNFQTSFIKESFYSFLVKSFSVAFQMGYFLQIKLR